MGKFEVYQDAKSEYRFRLKAGNGENILSSEGYKAKDGCLNGIKSVQNNCTDENRYELKTASNGKSFFNLKAKNGQVIGKSQMYSSESSAKNGISSVTKNGVSTTIVEE